MYTHSQLGHFVFHEFIWIRRDIHSYICIFIHSNCMTISIEISFKFTNSEISQTSRNIYKKNWLYTKVGLKIALNVIIKLFSLVICFRRKLIVVRGFRCSFLEFQNKFDNKLEIESNIYKIFHVETKSFNTNSRGEEK